MKLGMSRGSVVFLIGVAMLGGIVAAMRDMRAEDIREWAGTWLTVLAAAGVHELGHAVAAWGAGVRIAGLKLDLFGARMELKGLLSYGQEILVAAGGPFFNLLCALGTYPLALDDGETGWGLFCGASLVLGGVNLLPAGTLDGGRMLRCGAAWLWGDRVATGVWRATTAIFLGGLWMAAVYGLLRAESMLSLFAFSLCLLLRTLAGAMDCA